MPALLSGFWHSPICWNPKDLKPTGKRLQYRGARARGIFLTTIDTLIAGVALEHGASIFTLDGDFSSFARISSLALYQL